MKALGPALVAAALLGACGGAPARVAAVDQMDRVRLSPGAQEGAQLAPDVHARGELERNAALQARAAGDVVGATLHAERAIAAYGHALAVARRGRADAQAAEAQKALADAAAREQSLEASRAELEREATELEQRAQLARDRLLPAPSPTASGGRESARLAAARSFALEARLLCSAARLIGPLASDPAPIEGEVSKLEQRLEKDVHPAPIDEAARLRAGCLSALTLARRGAGGDPGLADTLLAELSASGGWEPARDERGVVVTLRGLFLGARLTDEAASRLAELGRVAGAHPGFAVQVVVHDAAPSLTKNEQDARHAEATVHALVAAGANPARTKAELAGARAPVVDPADAKNRARNERIDVVFVP